VEKASRRKFTTEYKLRILREVDRCKAPGQVGAVLRREGLYSSSLSQWRKQRDRIARVGLSARKRGPKRRAVDPHVKQLEQENAQLRRRLQRVEAMLEIQKKASELLGIPLNRLDSDEND
jgi:transposase-like protein